MVGDPLSGCVVRPSGPQQGASHAARYYSIRNRPLLTDQEGRAYIKGLIAGRYNVSASSAGYGTVHVTGIEATPGTVAHAELTYAGASLRGKVVDFAGKPVAGALVGAWRQVHVPRYAATDGLGRFRIADLVEETMRVFTNSGSLGSCPYRKPKRIPDPTRTPTIAHKCHRRVPVDEVRTV